MQEEFGRYTLLRRLAVGGMAEIFLAALHGDAGFEKQVVVKRILPHLGSDGEFVKMFIDEAILAARLSHPNLVQVYDFGSVAGSYFIAMEYIEGVDLHHLLRMARERQRPLTPAEVSIIGEGVARGLAYTHNLTDESGKPLGIVHRDISPHNLMLSCGGDAKVMDFGIAKAAARFSRTATGTIKGKLAYMAPEQAAGQSADKRSDQFALGVVLWECLAQERLFISDTEVSLMQTVITCNIPRLRDKRPDVPEALEAIIMRALSKDPAARYSDLAEMERDLLAFRFSLGGGGIVHLGDLAKAFLPTAVQEAAADWSWAAANGGAAPGGTRPMPAGPPPRRPTAPVPNRTPSHGTLRRRARPLLPAALRRRNTAPVAPPRPRTTMRIERDKRPVWRMRYLLPGAMVMLLGIGMPLAFWTGQGDLTAILAASRQGSLEGGLAQRRQASGGRLTLHSDGPMLDVYLGSARLGTTPMVDVGVPSGNLQLRLANKTAGIWRTYQIFVPDGGSAQGLISAR